MSDEPEIPDGVRALLARRQRETAQAAETRAAFRRRRTGGLQARHAAKLAATR